jgi:hypothetical protein
MKKRTIAQGIVLGAALTVVAALPAQALVIEQTQEMSVSGNARVEMTGGTGTAEATSNASGKQRQYIEMNTAAVTFAPTRTHVPAKKFKKGRPVATVRVRRSDGQVRLTWDMRGGTCHVRYTEVGASTYKYETSTSCDDGGITIGGLTPGVSYRFQVRQHDGGWSLPVTVKAW